MFEVVKEKPRHIQDENQDSRKDDQHCLSRSSDELGAFRLNLFGAVLNALRTIGLPLNHRKLVPLQRECFGLLLQLQLLILANLFESVDDSLGIMIGHVRCPSLHVAILQKSRRSDAPRQLTHFKEGRTVLSCFEACTGGTQSPALWGF